MRTLRGHVWCFGHNISTDLLMPSVTLYDTVPPEEQKLWCMRAIDPGFASNANAGDIVVAGQNFGCGSVRAAARNLTALGIRCVLAESFAGAFFRNGINSGLLLVELEDVLQRFATGDEYELDPGGRVTNLTRNETVTFDPLPNVMLEIVEAGGIVPMLQRELEAEPMEKTP